MSLTHYPEGSVRELWKVAFPLMLSSLSLLAMAFVDRIFLAHYDEQALSAAVTAGTAGWAILGSLAILGSMAEVFVAQYNGAKLTEKIGQPVWQMIWFSLLASLITLPLAIWGGSLLFMGSANQEFEIAYFRWLLVFGSAWPAQGAISAFWVGRGKTQMVTWVTLGANLVNVLLDWILIFGIEGVLQPMGPKGAAIATSTGSVAQFLFLLPLFLRGPNRRQYGTAICRFSSQLFWRCMRIGLPQAVSFLVELIGWAIFYIIIRGSGPEQIYVAGVAQSIVILFFFMAEGVGRGASAIAGNMMGEGRFGSTYKVFRAGLKLHLIFFAIASFFFVIWPDGFINLFTGEGGQALREHGGVGASFSIDEVERMLRVVLRLNLFYLLFEAVRWLVSGILGAAGDTFFILLIGILTVPIALILPTWLVVAQWGGGVELAFSVAIGFSCMTSTLFLVRYFGTRWQRSRLILPS